MDVWSFLLLFFFLNNRGCVGVTSCNDQELAQIAEICIASKCLEFFFLFFLFFNNRGCVGVTSCHDQELAQIVEICVACKCLEFFFSFFLITVDVWVSVPATIKNWPNLHKFVLEVNVWSFFSSPF